MTARTLNENAELIFLAALAIVGLYLSYLLLRPYAAPILFSVVLAIIFYPLHGRLVRTVRNQSAAALLATLITLFATVLPLVLLGLALSRELTDLYRTLAIKGAAEGGVSQVVLRYADTATEWIRLHLGVHTIDLRATALQHVEQASAGIVRFGAETIANVFTLVVDSAITFLVLFFLFRDGKLALSRVISALPMSEIRASELVNRIGSTVNANFYGGLAVAAAQGTLAGLAFHVLGLESAILWGFATAIASLLPLVGSATVWVPIAIVLAFSGHLLKAILLVVWGAGVVAMVDNLIRPLILRAGMQLHTVYIFFALLGGVRAFGILGLFAGPVILSVTIAVLGMLQDELSRKDRAEWTAAAPR